ncbi:MAG: hypothetical protein B7Z72_05910, partial [Gemmatimonadetes bacterium 21-71-4]
PAALDLAAQVRPRWRLVAASSALVFATYAVLIQTWRVVLREIGGELSFGEAAYVWLVANLARYLPGSLWQIGALGTLARRHGIPIANTTAAALVLTVANVITGLILFGVLGATQLHLDAKARLIIGVGIVALAAAPFVAARSSRLLSAIFRRPVTVPHPNPRAIGAAVVGTTLGWIGYGFAFQLLAAGLLPAAGAGAGHAAYVATYAGSYLAGFLSILPPAGLGVAEAAMVHLGPLFGVATAPQAALLAIGVRIWRTVNEIAPGALALLVPADRLGRRG